MAEYSRIRALWPDHLGLARGKYLPARLAEAGTNHSLSVFSLGYDREIYPAPHTGIEAGFPDMEARFSMGDVRPGWEESTGVVVAGLSYEGDALRISPRETLQRAIHDWAALGFAPKVGIELEGYILEPDGAGGWKPWDTPGAFVYGTGSGVDPVGLMDEIMTVAERMGLPIEAINSEFDPPQFEMTLEYGDALQACDEVFLFKVMAREVAQSMGLLLTFMGRPLGDRGGNGTHVNLSFEDVDGSNVFHDPDAEDGLSDMARSCIAGLLEHHRGMTALCAPTVNAYKRLRPAQMSGYWANWGYDNRCVGVRVPPTRGQGTRLESRLADGAVSPHMATAAVLQAARLGFTAGAQPPDPETGDGIEEVCTDIHVPTSLNEALDAMEADTEFTSAIGPELAEHFLVIKRAEWERFDNAVTDWEMREYLPFL